MSLSSFDCRYDAEVLGEVPGDGQVRYFPDGRCQSPLLVRFTLPDGSSWVGGFGEGTLAARACSGVFSSPSSTRACVVSRGCAYAVDVADPEATTILVPELVMQVVPHAAEGVLLLADPWELHAWAAGDLEWSTGRIAVEGLIVASVDDRIVVVHVENADGELEERRIDARTGQLVTDMPRPG